MKITEPLNQNNFTINPSIITDLNIWQKVRECKKEFFEQNIDPRNSPYIPLEVAESWIRSKQYGLDPYKKLTAQKNSPEGLNRIAKNKKLLMQATIPLIKKYLSLLSASDYRMMLTDENGTNLYIEGNDNDILPIPPFGSLLNENVIGTTAHGLCCMLRRPVQFIGPYNYCVHLDDNLVSSTPIFENGDLIGTLTIYQIYANKNIHNMQTHSLGWISSMAVAIEKHLMLAKANDQLEMSNGILKATVSVIDGGLITLDKDGLISHINEEGCRILDTASDEVLRSNFKQYFKETQLITQALESAKTINNHEITVTNKTMEKQYLMSVNPILGENEENVNGAVIHLAHMENIKKLVNDWRGAQATYSFDSIKGKNPLLLTTIKKARQFAKLNASVLIQGESGTGKELFAQSIHSTFRPEGPFISINCSAMPRDLIESELFGYEGGTFTGAEKKGRPGLIELAHGGTLFLDEIGDMPLEIQPVLLRVLEEKKVRRIGGKKYIPVDFRVIAASNKNLHSMVADKTFRQDLYYRLAVFKLEIPPLRKRKEDIIDLAQYFINNISRKIGCSVPDLSNEVQNQLLEYQWPGNIRQLENAMVYAVSVAQNGIIKVFDLPEDIINLGNNFDISMNSHVFTNSPFMTLQELEIATIRNTMNHVNNNIADAAKLLGLGKSTMYKKLKQYDIPY
ncbi:sigma-54 interaction domain-containing protein [Sporomusa acidovorans]|uniref:Anaerobic nitric oxide reductase transcription regulator NorR n=1 Tax=Sporomusa acidovorans (strain ATCC 49682 / DSM 3132 / Mol) TaxID=1123286 RepID=A0ABZ3JAJ6_SPOA4|nr:sigma 54-interacting transcriptional regulator [Sporomusa acidovorans]OZC21852.1 arginine utilization regulatory protein RocR [Sporomusa acidovorans DSM 3132]SDD54791.1 Transcriptional regulator containing PAS, AAA-type ATPase, and DNA-binding Fis domains [Sporomusa acidovorans]